MHLLRISDSQDVNCLHPETAYVRVRIANGSEQIRTYCIHCAEVFGPAYKRDRFTATEIEQMAVGEDWTRTRPPCVVCGSRGTEEHHWAPRALFGEEAYVWPTSWLCPACHQRWHQTVQVAR